MTVPSAARRRPAGRYDPPSLLGQRVLAVLLGVLVLALLVAAGAALWERSTGERVSGQVRTYDIRSDEEVVMQITVAKSAGARAYCVVRARDRTGREVARDVAVLDAEGTDSEQARTRFVLRTSARAVTAEIAGCGPEPISRETPGP